MNAMDRPRKSELFLCEMGCGRAFTLRKNMKRHIKNLSCRRNYGPAAKADAVLRGGKYVFLNNAKD